MRSLLCLLGMAASAIAGDPSASVVKLEYPSGSFCSGVSVGGGFILTAEHCGCENDVTVTFRSGAKLKAVAAHDPAKNNRDQVVVLRLEKDAPSYSTISRKSPSKGDKVTSYGYPGGKFSMNEGLITTANKSFTETDFWILGGNSGGGLFNAEGRLVGIASARGDLNDRPRAVFVSLSEIQASVKAVSEVPVSDYTKSNEVIIFTTPGCAPCERLKRDIKAGFFKSFKTKTVEYRAGVWSEPSMADEMFKAVPEGTPMAFPLIWVRGTSKVRTGYSPDRRGGLIGFLATVLDGIGRIVIGEPNTPDFPPRPYRRNQPDESPLDVPPPAPEEDPISEPKTDVESKLDKLRADLEKLKSSNPLDKIRGVVALKTDVGELKDAIANNKPDMTEVDSLREKLAAVKGDLETLQSGNPIAKIKALGSLKSEVAELKTIAGDTKDKAKEDPWLFLLGLPGLLTGLMHRKMAA